MNTKRVNAAAGVIHAAQRTRQTATGIAVVLEAAGLLQSPESAAEQLALVAEVDKLRALVAELEAAQSTTVADRDAQIIAWLMKKAGEYRSVPRSRQESAADAIARVADKISRGAVRGTEAASPWERAVAGLNALVDADIAFWIEPDGHISGPFGDEHIEWDQKKSRWVLTHDEDEDSYEQSVAAYLSTPYTDDTTPAPTEDPHESPLHHTYETGRDLPRRPGACDGCGDVPEQWCPDCAACRQGCHGGHDGNPCSHPRAPWGGAS
ncbi:hypothetical protein OG195_27465 [Streptomyces sp. NBC_01362]|uniref:hypothetical protein n=1 Tax=Streptomyces sp. NBC_01362 TaxID=2903839 RepID=UPI002E367543|nr:hypothetical protein [Streptomyces sp. NBC_01362]